jgi:hypothetical protein
MGHLIVQIDVNVLITAGQHQSNWISADTVFTDFDLAEKKLLPKKDTWSTSAYTRDNAKQHKVMNTSLARCSFQLALYSDLQFL